MCCVVAALFTLGPRAAILFWWLVQPIRWGETFDTFLWPLLGFLFLPWTTLMYVLVYPGGINGFDYIWLGFGIAIRRVQLGRWRMDEPRSVADVRGLTDRLAGGKSPSMRLTVLGGAGGYPPAAVPAAATSSSMTGSACSSTRYAIVPRLLEIVPAEAIDAVLVSHGHPDHVADLNPLLRARLMHDDDAPRLPAYALPDALSPVLALDQITALERRLRGPRVRGRRRVPDRPVRDRVATAPPLHPERRRSDLGGWHVDHLYGRRGAERRPRRACTGTDLLLAEATYVDAVPPGNAGVLNSALEVGRQAHRAGAARLMLTHLMPGTDPEASAPPRAAPSTTGSRWRRPARSWSSSRASGPRADRRRRRVRSRQRRADRRHRPRDRRPRHAPPSGTRSRSCARPSGRRRRFGGDRRPRRRGGRLRRRRSGS